MDDWLLLEGARKGSHQEWSALFLRHRDRLFRLAFAVLHNREQAEDLMQDCLLKLVTGPFPPRRESFSGYTGTIIWRQALRVRKDSARLDGLPELLPVDARDTPESDLLQRERENLALAALEALPPAQRSVLQLRLIGGLSYQEMADVLDLPVGTIRSRLHNGLKACRQRIGEGR